MRLTSAWHDFLFILKEWEGKHKEVTVPRKSGTITRQFDLHRCGNQSFVTVNLHVQTCKIFNMKEVLLF